MNNKMSTWTKLEDQCCICMDTTTKPKTLSCKHTFCTECIDQWFSTRPTCPSCGVAHGVIKGSQPNGRMDHRIIYDPIPGYDDSSTIEITYFFPSGTQGPKHPKPGVPYSGTNRIAYLPNNKEGQKVLKLLQSGFEARLVFTIGRSVTTGRDNTVTWNDIHHKTSIHGGPESFGYPDPHYLSRVQEELAANGIK